MKFGEHTEDIRGPISITDISKFTGDTNEDSVVSGHVCVPNTTRSGDGEEQLYWELEGRQIPRSTPEDGDLSGWVAVIYTDGKKPNLALQGFQNKQAKEGIFTCFYRPKRHGRIFFIRLGIYFPSE